MVSPISSQAIAPTTLLRGQGAWGEALPYITQLCQRPLLLGRSMATQPLRDQLSSDLEFLGLSVTASNLRFDCCEVDLHRLADEAQSCDAILAAGGGKVLDAGKLLAHRLKLPCITVPLSAATCAGWTALANLYTPDGAFERDVVLDRCPDLLVFDHAFVRQAPPRTLASGIADALAKWYEASVSSADSRDGLVQQAVQMARVLRDQLLIDSPVAIADSTSAAWERTIESCGLTAGVNGRGHGRTWWCSLPHRRSSCRAQRPDPTFCMPSHAAWRKGGIWNFGAAGFRGASRQQPACRPGPPSAQARFGEPRSSCVS